MEAVSDRRQRPVRRRNSRHLQTLGVARPLHAACPGKRATPSGHLRICPASRQPRSIFIRLEARLQPNIGFTLRRVLAVFTRSAITPPKVNRFE